MKKCERCGQNFMCGASQGSCWCFALPVVKDLPEKYQNCLCEKCLQSFMDEDYYFDESGLMVFTEKYHLKRGHCCQSGCRNCPYGFIKGS